jgi:hypothetical protein
MAAFSSTHAGHRSHPDHTHSYHLIEIGCRAFLTTHVPAGRALGQTQALAK